MQFSASFVSIGALLLTTFMSGFTSELPEVGTTQSPEATQLATEIIADFEGFRETAYWDVNAPRNGFGSDTMTDEFGNITAVTMDSVTTKDDAKRDLQRRVLEFKNTIKEQSSTDLFLSLPPNTQAALTSVAYNYGSLPETVVAAVESGDIEAIAQAVEDLKTQDNGINAHRRIKEAEIIREDLR